MKLLEFQIPLQINKLPFRSSTNQLFHMQCCYHQCSELLYIITLGELHVLLLVYFYAELKTSILFHYGKYHVIEFTCLFIHSLL